MLSVDEAERFLVAEARLLDERRFEEWEALFTDDAVYWVPMDPDRDPADTVSIIYDDRKRLHERVYRLTRTPVLDQNPPSRTVRFVANVEVEPLDGAGEATVFLRVALPLAKPALAALGVFVFTAEWNAYLWPLVVTNTPEMRTVQLGLALFRGQFGTDWALLMAANVVATLPVVVVFLVAQRFFVQTAAFEGFR
jgi:hypothetical protein